MSHARANAVLVLMTSWTVLGTCGVKCLDGAPLLVTSNNCTFATSRVECNHLLSDYLNYSVHFYHHLVLVVDIGSCL